MYRIIALLAALMVIGCGDDGNDTRGPTWFDQPEADLPAEFSGFGTFDGSEIRRADVVRAYEPRFPLWSAGAEKSRAVALPSGASIDTTGSVWVVPTGAVFFKTFYWEDAPVETRVMRRLADDWEFAAYLWDRDGADAERLEMRRSTPVEVSWEGQVFEHRVPNENDCRKCHEPTEGMILAFDELQLSTQVDTLHELGIVSNPLGSTPRELPAGSELEREVLGGMVGNCVNCHNGSDHDQSSFDLAPEVAFENLIGEETASSAAAAGVRVVPGEPSESMMYLAISGTSDDPEIKEMPPVGLELRDEAWVSRVSEWIEELPTEN
jgi:hypothetical protein